LALVLSLLLNLATAGCSRCEEAFVEYYPVFLVSNGDPVYVTTQRKLKLDEKRSVAQRLDKGVYKWDGERLLIRVDMYQDLEVMANLSHFADLSLSQDEKHVRLGPDGRPDAGEANGDPPQPSPPPPPSPK